MSEPQKTEYLTLLPGGKQERTLYALEWATEKERDDALRDLRAMAALRERGVDTTLNMECALARDWYCEANFIGGKSDALRSDPADAILAALADSEA